MNFDHGKRVGTVLLAKMGLDDFEVGLLSIARHFFASFAQPETQAWHVAFRISAERWGIGDGAKAACAMLDIADAMRRARPTEFTFSDPTCPTCREALTPNERHLMSMIHAIRRGRIGDAQTAAMLLTEGARNTDLIRAGWVMAGLFPAEKASADRPMTHFTAQTTLGIH